MAEAKGELPLVILFTSGLLSLFYIVRLCITFVLREKRSFLVGMKRGCPFPFKTGLAVKTQIPTQNDILTS